MILNIGLPTATVLLEMVDSRATELRKQIRTVKGEEKAEAIRLLQHMGLLKHRLEYNMGFADPFIGPKAWGHPLNGKALT